MGRSLCVQLKLMVNRLEFKIAFSIMLFIALASFALAACMEMLDEYTEVLDLRDANSYYLLNSCGQLWLAVKFLIPFLAVLPFATSYIGDRSSGYIGMYIGRVSYRNYLRSKLCACFIGGFILVFIPLIINLTLCNAAFVHNGSHYMGDIGSTILADNLTGRTLNYNTARIPLFRWQTCL